MGCCTGRCLLITLCIIQLVAIVERQVFDFLGYMWAPIIGNFLQIIFVIIGFFGTLQYRPKLLLVYSVWSVLWIGWNIFIICFYLEVGILDRDMPILNLGTDNYSWWLDHGIGCELVNNETSSSTSHNSLVQRDVPDEEDITGCIIQYYYVEVIHAAIQCFLGLIGFCVACYVVYVFTEEDDSCKYPVYLASKSAPLSPNNVQSDDLTKHSPRDEDEEDDIFSTAVVTRRSDPQAHKDRRSYAKSRSCSAIHDSEQRRSRCSKIIMNTSQPPDPLARASFFSAHDSWTLPTYVSFNDDLESWNSLGLSGSYRQ